MMNIEQFQQIVRNMHPKLLQHAKQLTQHSEEAEDLVQEVFIRLWLSKDQLEKYDNIEAVAVRALRNKIIDTYRKRKIDSDQIENQIIEAKEKNAHQQLELREDMQIILAIIHQLPPLQQLIIKLKDIEGYEIEEIVKITQSSADSVRANLSRARRKVREQFCIEVNRNNHEK